jgi:glycosyltransferase involved in cell wall biosynthesis
MGRFDLETKGVDLLLHALAALQPGERPQARLHGPDWRGGKQRALELVRELGLEDSVVIGPALYGADKWRALRECRLFVFPSRWDAQGLIALEAAAVSAPLLVTNTTSLGRYLGANDAAVVVDATAESIAAGIVAAYSSEALSLGVRASQVVREQFSWPVVAASYATQIKALVKESTVAY